MDPLLKPESAVFYSTNRGWPWGAPDYVWPDVARKLLNRSVPVIVITHPANLNRSEIQQLQAAGARCYTQPELQIPGGRLAGWRRWRQRQSPHVKKLHQALSNLPRPHFFINQGGDFDFAEEEQLFPYLDHPEISYDIIVHSTQEQPPLAATKRLKIQHILQQAHRVCFNSEWSRDIVETKLLSHFDNAYVFSHPIKCPIECLPWPEGKIARLACVNRLDVFHKGLDVLLLALAKMKDTSVAWELNIFGDGPDHSHLQSMIRWLNLQQNVHLHCFESDVQKIWRENHMLILTSRYEGFGVSMLEAMACGRPVLRTPYGGAKQWIQNQQNGFICPAPEPDLIRTTLNQALEIFSQWKFIGEAAHTTIAHQQSPPPEMLFIEPFQHLETPL